MNFAGLGGCVIKKGKERQRKGLREKGGKMEKITITQGPISAPFKPVAEIILRKNSAQSACRIFGMF